MPVRYTERAADELAGILDYLRERSPAGAASVRQAMLRAERLIAAFPDAGARTDVQGVHELSVPRYGYKLYYAVGPDAVWIVHVRDGRRRPWIANAPEDDESR